MGKNCPGLFILFERLPCKKDHLHYKTDHDNAVLLMFKKTQFKKIQAFRKKRKGKERKVYPEGK